ncbi:MAG: NAD+ synthase [Hyphomicrobiaceae bacterium]
MKIALAQLNPTVGDIDGNGEKVIAAHAQAKAAGGDLVVLPELFLTGYPPEDLVLRTAFQAAAHDKVQELAQTLSDGPGVLLGTIWQQGGELYNAVVLLDRGKIEAVRFKVDLPNYGVFDEKRVFASGPLPGPVNFRDVRIGVPICEDIWNEEVTECLQESGAEFFLVPNGSPFDWKKPDLRTNIAVARVAETDLALAYVNQVGGQDELVFDGASFVLNPDHSLACQLPQWSETIVVTEWHEQNGTWRCKPGDVAKLDDGDASAYQGCMLGLRDYVHKNRFPGVVLGLSGGIDSALVAAIATDALGADKVRCVMLPYRYTSEESLEDAAQCAKALSVPYEIVPIGEAVEGFHAVLGDMFAGSEPGITEENIQSRVRGTALMAISNKFGAMVVTTGNKSEMSVGYATLYGDMNGGFNPIKDLYKTEVFRIAAWRNAHVPKGGLGPSGTVIANNILTKAPTAELREDQKDADSLPPYDVLDDILTGLVEEELALADIVARGHEADLVARIQHLLYISEYKRRQAAPGVKISSRSFGRERRYPITNRFRETAQKVEKSRPMADAPEQVLPSPDGGDM